MKRFNRNENSLNTSDYRTGSPTRTFSPKSDSREMDSKSRNMVSPNTVDDPFKI